MCCFVSVMILNISSWLQSVTTIRTVNYNDKELCLKEEFKMVLYREQ